MIDALLEIDHEVVCLDLKTTPGRLGDVAGRVTFVGGGLCGVQQLVDLITEHDVDAIAHLVYRPQRDDVSRLREELEAMVGGTADVFEAAARARVRRVVFPSSIHYYGRQEVHGEVALSESAPPLAETMYGITKHLNERIAGNALLPRLDLVGSYGVNGASGLSRPIISTTNVPGGNCVNNPATPGTFLCSSPFAGPASDAYDRLRSNDYKTYSFGLQLQVPLSNALARSQYTESRIARSQAELNHRELLSRVTLQARQTVSDVITGRQRIDTARVARELAEENLRNQEKRHEVGIATTKDLLDFQTRLTSARAAEVQATVDYAIAVSRWRRAQGLLLSHYQIVIDQPGRHSTPWFARF